MQEELPRAGVQCTILPRLCRSQTPVSASAVRQILKEHGPSDELSGLVPETTLRWLRSPEAEPVLQRIAAQQDVRHH